MKLYSLALVTSGNGIPLSELKNGDRFTYFVPYRNKVLTFVKSPSYLMPRDFLTKRNIPTYTYDIAVDDHDSHSRFIVFIPDTEIVELVKQI